MIEMTFEEAIDLSLLKWKRLANFEYKDKKGHFINPSVAEAIIGERSRLLRGLRAYCGLCDYQTWKHNTTESLRCLDCPLDDRHIRFSPIEICAYEYYKWRSSKSPRWARHWANKLHDRIKNIKEK